MATSASPVRSSKGGLIFRDSLIFLALCGVSVALFLVTLGLFRSFEDHREELGKRWAQRGETALREGHPAAAVAALRTALTYRDTLPEQLLLAQALANAGRTEEASNYFLNLRESRPGDGFVNLQLARLTRKQGDAPQAIDYYRAAIFGNWEGDGTTRRREVRLELADYLAERGQTSAARDELMVAAGNAPETDAGDVLIGDRLAAIGDGPDALSFYEKAAKLHPHDRGTLAKAGRLAYGLGQYGEAYKLLTGALAEKGSHEAETPEQKLLATLASNAHRVPELSLSRDLPASERAEHLLLASRIAQTRLAGCMAPLPLAPVPAPPAVSAPAAAAPGVAAPGVAALPPLQMLRARWLAALPQLNKRTLARDATLEDQVTQLIDDTEQQTVQPCGPPSGDDAVLLMLVNTPPNAHP